MWQHKQRCNQYEPVGFAVVVCIADAKSEPVAITVTDAQRRLDPVVGRHVRVMLRLTGCA